MCRGLPAFRGSGRRGNLRRRGRDGTVYKGREGRGRAVRRGDRSSRLLGLAAVGMWCALMTHNLVDNLYVHYIQLLPAMLLGLVVLCRGADCGLTGDRT